MRMRVKMAILIPPVVTLLVAAAMVDRAGAAFAPLPVVLLSPPVQVDQGGSVACQVTNASATKSVTLTIDVLDGGGNVVDGVGSSSLKPFGTTIFQVGFGGTPPFTPIFPDKCRFTVGSIVDASVLRAAIVGKSTDGSVVALPAIPNPVVLPPVQ